MAPHPARTSGDLVMELSGHGSVVGVYLERNPAVASALAKAGVTLVLFELESAREGDGGLAARLRRALDQAEAALPDHVAIPIFLADAMARDLFPRAKSDAAAAPLDVSVRRGRFVGFVASGEGGAILFDATGRPGNGRIDDVVRGVLEFSHALK